LGSLTGVAVCGVGPALHDHFKVAVTAPSSPMHLAPASRVSGSGATLDGTSPYVTHGRPSCLTLPISTSPEPPTPTTPSHAFPYSPSTGRHKLDDDLTVRHCLSPLVRKCIHSPWSRGSWRTAACRLLCIVCSYC
jgi:hypothetical protein